MFGNEMADVSIDKVRDAFVESVESILQASTASRPLFMADEKRRLLHFRPRDFKRALAKVVGEDVKLYMTWFRTLDWILCETERFTISQRIAGKSVRVITVDQKKVNLLKVWS